MEIRNVGTGLPTPLIDALKRNAASRPMDGGQAPSFTGAFDQALKAVSAQQGEASRMAEEFQVNPAGVSLEQTMVAMQKSQIAFQSALHVRNRLVSAYTDIMNMQV